MTQINFSNESLESNKRSIPGRQRQVFDLLSLFQTSKLVALIGDNGSGKTHLVHRGLIPELEKGFLGRAGKTWKTISIRPGITPLENLAAGIVQLNSVNGKQQLQEEILLTQLMKRNYEGLKNMFLQNFDQMCESNSLIIIDNFEDLFKYQTVAKNSKEWDESVKSFIFNLCKCAANPTIPAYFLLILRTDFVPKIFEYRQFYDIISNAQYNLPQFRKSEFSAVIRALLKPYKKTISTDALDFLYLELGKDLKNLTLIGLFVQAATVLLESKQEEEIRIECFDEISIDSLYEKKLESFYLSHSPEGQKLIEKIMKQTTISAEGAKFRKPVQLGHFLKISGSSITELGDLIQAFQEELEFVLDIVFQFNERLEMPESGGISETTVMDIKNEQFISHWPRLLHWIKEEKDSQDLYKRLSDKATLHEKGLTDFLKPPDLDLAIAWYKEKKPDELWSRQFDNNHEKTVRYLVDSEKKYHEDLNKKEFEQKERIKRIRRTSFYVILGSFFVVLLVSFFAIKASQAQKEAEDSALAAKIEKLEADASREKALEATIEAEKSKEEAMESAISADSERKKAKIEQEIAEKAMETAKISEDKALKSKNKLEQNQVVLIATSEELQKQKDAALKAETIAKNAEAYQKAINSILTLRSAVENNPSDSSVRHLIEELKPVYLNYQKTSFDYQNIVLPNNDLYQLLQLVRDQLVKKNLLAEIKIQLSDLVANGLRKVSISPMGNIASGGDDGIIIFSNKPISLEKPELLYYSIGKDRIRSIVHLNEKELAIGTVTGRLLNFNTETQVLFPISLGSTSKPIIEKLILSQTELFVLASEEIIKVDLKQSNALTRVNRISAKNMFKLGEDKLLITSKDNSLIVMDINTLQWVTVATDLKKIPVTAALISENTLFVGLENGEIQVCRFTQLGNAYTINTEYQISAHRTRITGLDFDQRTSKLFSSSLDQTASIFDLKLRSVNPEFVSTYKYKLEGFEKWIWDFGLLQMGAYKFLISADESGKLTLWPAEPEKVYEEIISAGSRIPK